MQQEEDWDREGLLDPAWERQQRKVNHESSPKRGPTVMIIGFKIMKSLDFYFMQLYPALINEEL